MWPFQKDNFPLILASKDLSDLIESQDWTECKQWYNLWMEYNDLTRPQNLLINDDWVKSRNGELEVDDITSTYYWMGRTMKRWS